VISEDGQLEEVILTPDEGMKILGQIKSHWMEDKGSHDFSTGLIRTMK
jgi:hypothetical protein